MAIPTERELLIIRGKCLVGHQTTDEMLKVFAYIDYLEMRLDETDNEDMFGTEGWRHYFDLGD